MLQHKSINLETIQYPIMLSERRALDRGLLRRQSPPLITTPDLSIPMDDGPFCKRMREISGGRMQLRASLISAAPEEEIDKDSKPRDS